MADFETELRFGEDTAIFEADGALNGKAVGDAEGLLGFTELEVGLAAADDTLLEATLLVEGFDETADERKADAVDFELDFAGVLLAGAADLDEATDLEACRISISSCYIQCAHLSRLSLVAAWEQTRQRA